MGFLTNDKLVIVGAAGMIGSNMAQTAAMLKLTPNICLYDIFEPGLKGVLAEMDHLYARVGLAVVTKQGQRVVGQQGVGLISGLQFRQLTAHPLAVGARQEQRHDEDDDADEILHSLMQRYFIVRCKVTK